MNQGAVVGQGQRVEVLTPKTVVDVIGAGYRVGMYGAGLTSF